MPDEDETIRLTADTRTTPEVCTRCHTAPVEHLGEAGLHGVCCTTCVDIAIADGHTCPTCQGTAPMPDVVRALGLSIDGPSTPDTVTTAVTALVDLAHYLAHATTDPDITTRALHYTLGGLIDALHAIDAVVARLDQAVEQAYTADDAADLGGARTHLARALAELRTVAADHVYEAGGPEVS